MKKNRSIQLKAVFLLMVFSLNTIIGFACSIGLDMGYNSNHHGDSAAIDAEIHIQVGEKKSNNSDNSHQPREETVIHKDVKKHIHQKKKENHSHTKPHKHHQVNKSKNSKSQEGDCCTGKVKEFQDLDKSVPGSQNNVHPVFFTALVAHYGNIILLPPTNIVQDIKRFVRNHHPPIPDIRVAIQSFQI